MTKHPYEGLSAFDLDHTLVKGNSSFRFGFFLFRKRVLSFPLLCRLILFYVRHKIFHLPAATLHREALRCFIGGRSHTEIQRLVRDFISEEGDELIHKAVAKRLEDAKNQGHYTAILSNSPSFLVGPLAERFAVDEWHATEYGGCRNQRFANKIRSLEGADKAFICLGMAARLGLDSDAITAYSDSHLDLPFLEVAGSAVAVNPDKALRRISEQRHWEIID